MSPGLSLYTSSLTADGTTTIYTVPPGISYQIVHLVVVAEVRTTSLSGAGLAEVRLNGTQMALIQFNFPPSGTNSRIQSKTINIVLSPGDTFTLTASLMAGGATAKGVVYISGYDVP